MADKLDRIFVKVYREQAMIEQDSECAYCYEKLTFKTVTADHVKPKKSNGKDTKENIVACCELCNKAKDCMPVNKFKAYIKSREIPKCDYNWKIILTWSRRRINLALKRMNKNVMERCR